MALTPQSRLREWIITVLQDSPDGSAKRSDVLDAMERRFGAHFTDDDLEPPASRPFETNWRNRASFERARMVRDGVLTVRADGVWELTAGFLR